MPLTKEEKQAAREGVLSYLADRPTMSFTVSAIARMVKKRAVIDFDVSEADIAEALAVLQGYGLVREIMPKLGSIREYQVTSDGVVFDERS